MPRVLGALGGVVVMSLGVLVAPVAGAAVMVDAVPEASWHVDGVVYATAVSGDTLVVGGAFGNAVGPSGELLPRANLAAFSLATGAPLSDWVADTDAPVRALVTDGLSVWAGGGFRAVSGRVKNRLVKLDGGTGAVDLAFRASVNNTVRALALSGGEVVLGGNFGQVNGVSRPRVAKVHAGSGALNAGFVAEPNGTVSALAAAPGGGTVYVGGAFTAIGATARAGLAAVDGTTGTLSPLVLASSATTLGLDLSPDGSTLYGALGGSGNAAVAWSTMTGARLWRAVADGDVQAVRLWEGSVYFGFHESFGGDTTLRVLAADAGNGSLDPEFRPAVAGFWGIYTIAASGAGIVVGGDFTAVAGAPARSMAIFHADRPIPTEYVTGGTSWRYLAQGLRPTGWESPSLDDSTWASGRPQLGYGDGDEVTVVPMPASRYAALYARTSFTVEALPGDLTLQLVADDGAAVYLNGAEVIRDNLPQGALNDTTRAVLTRSGAAETQVRSYVLDPSLLRAGTNTLAVEVHQASGAWNDASLDVRLSGHPAP